MLDGTDIYIYIYIFIKKKIVIINSDGFDSHFELNQCYKPMIHRFLFKRSLCPQNLKNLLKNFTEKTRDRSKEAQSLNKRK